MALLGESEAIRTLRQEVAIAAASGARVLITGETGTGKELVARLVHAQSGRGARRPMMSINCAGLSESLLESELFGHERGSFTGAEMPRSGVLGSADGGTVFLDEIGDMSPRLQALLLRFLDSGEIQRVGARSPTRVDVRIIAATHLNLIEGVAANTFRSDLFYRLNVLRLHTTALRERRDDIPMLLSHFLGVYAAGAALPAPELTPRALNMLVQYDWPGNVRELRNFAERLVAARGVRRIDAADLTDLIPAQALPLDKPDPDITTAEVLYRRMCQGGESFWAVVHGPFVAHDLTRDEVRAVVALGLQATGDDYKALVRLFNMETQAYRRFMEFLRKYGCLATTAAADPRPAPSRIRA